MDKLPVLVLLVILTIVKLICTGIFLVIGFRIGGKIYETLEPKVINKFKVAPISEPVTGGA